VEVQAVLRKRLLVIAAVIGFVFAVYALVSTVLFVEEPVVPWLCALLLAWNGSVAALLWSDRPLSLRQLRWIEGGLFGALAALFTWFEYRFFPYGLLSQVPVGDTSDAVLLARGLSLHWFTLIVAYGVLIPNTWQRSVAVVGAMTLWALLLNAVLVLRSRTTVTIPSFLLEVAIRMGTAAALAVYGAHRIESLRQQAARARTLGQYRLKQLLGAGGMGEVYLAEHLLLKRPCAVKLIRPERAGDPKNLLRFEREVRATAALTHPNTVEVLDYGHAEDGTFYYVMEYLPGLTLEQLVQWHGPLPPARAVHLLLQVCGALSEAHAAGLIHRDIKPGNVLVCERGGRPDVAKLLDFGLVQTMGLQQDGQALTQEGAIHGTPAYMSPEQAAGKGDLDARSDLYSLGAVAYFLLTGRPPFVRDSAVQTLAAHLGKPVVAPNRYRPDAPADLSAVVLRCLEKDPGRRFPDADELARALARCACAAEWNCEHAAAWWRVNADGDARSTLSRRAGPSGCEA
jgi:serine/threonine-protein kinase